MLCLIKTILNVYLYYFENEGGGLLSNTAGSTFCEELLADEYMLCDEPKPPEN